MSSEDDVGYGRPPQATRFKPGQSGNPRGRPKGSVNLGTALNRTMRERIVIVEQGRRKTISKAEAIAKQAANRAVSGDPVFTRLVIQMSQWAVPLAEEVALGSRLDADDKAVMQSLLARMKATPKEENHG